MADKKISALTAATTPLAGTEVLPIVQGGATVKVSVDNLTAGKPVSMSNLTYTGTVTGGTGVITIGTNQISKDASGNVGIGVATPVAKLDVRGNIFTTGAFIAGANVAAPTADASIYRAADNTLAFATGSTQRVSIDSSGNTTLATGNLVIGTAGKGIDFSADPSAAGMTSELLDDYEEGTWTPTLISGTGTITSFTSTGRYTKTGRLVVAEIRIGITNNGTGAGNLRIGSFPFAAFSAQALTSATREDTAVGFGIVGSGLSATEIVLTKTDGAYPGGTGYGFTLVVSYSV